MEMNRYLIAALYVMAGCAVTVPLKAQVEYPVLERCSMIVTHAVRTIADSGKEAEERQRNGQSAYQLKQSCRNKTGKKRFVLSDFSCDKRISLCYIVPKIRAPEM